VDKAGVIAKVCDALGTGDRVTAAAVARSEYPFEPRIASGRRYNKATVTQLFSRDGFIDRYSGNKLVFPGALLLLSRLLPEEFPAHPNWKMSESHFMYWELWPTVDHVVPVARGGNDDPSNWVTTSMLRNAAKGHWTLEELEWKLVPAGQLADWDGLSGWFLEFVGRDQSALESRAIREWRQAAIASLESAPR
jgi:hypothetical protein